MISKKVCMAANGLLLVWFFFDMIGFAIGDFVLVESAWKGIDGIWFLIFMGLFGLFCIRDRYGKAPLSVFLFIWAAVQFSSHWYYTIFGVTKDKLFGYTEVFADTYHLIPASDSRLIPDFYHMVLHLFIAFALISTALYWLQSKKRRFDRHGKV